MKEPKIPIAVILKALRRRNIDDTIIYWIKNFLSYRYIKFSLSGDDLNIHASVGCRQGGVLSPILWCLVVDLFLEDLKSLNLFCIGYVDDVIVIRGKFINTYL